MPGIVVVQPIGVHHKVHLFPIRLMHGKGAAAILAIISYVKLLLHQLE